MIAPNDLTRKSEAKEYALREIAPLIDQYEHNPEQTRTLFDKAVQDGYSGIDLSPTVGGKGLNYLQTALIYEGLAHGGGEFAFFMQLHNNITLLIERLSQAPHIQDIVKRMVAGELLCGYAFTEQNAGSDPSANQGIAVLKEDGYHVTATKDWIANAGEADYFILIVKDESPKGMVMFLVDKNTAGITVDDKKQVMAGKLLQTARIHFEDVIIPENMVLSQRGFQEALASIDVARIFVPAICVGVAQRCLDVACEYLAGRVSMGQPVLKSQGIQWRLAELTAKVSAARQLVYHAAELMDSGDSQMPYLAAQAKLLVPSVAMEVSTQCLQYMGAIGCDESHEMSRHFRMLKIFNMVDGSEEIQKFIVGRALAKDFLSK